MTQKIKELLIKIKKEKPLILNITKYFPLDLIVSGLRSIGAFPITSNAEQEIEELLKLSKSVVINLGKLDDEFINYVTESVKQQMHSRSLLFWIPLEQEQVVIERKPL